MFELHKVAKNTYYIESPAKIGLYADESGRAVLIDSGNDKEAGRKIQQILKANNWELKLILNTHSNADHIGGNAFLQQRTNCEIRSTPIENMIAANPHIEPSYLFGGFPPKPLRNKFLMAQPSAPSGTLYADIPEGFEILPLPGHYFDMVGVRTPDDVLFLADCLSGAHIIEKYHINFLYDVKAYLATLSQVEAMEAALFIPSHAEPVQDIRPLVKINRDKVHEIISLVLGALKSPMTGEDMLKHVLDHYSLTMDFNQYALVGSTLRSYLAYLYDAGSVEVLFEENRLFWKAV